MDKENLEQIANKVAQQNATAILLSIAHNSELVGETTSIGIGIASTKMTLALVVSQIFSFREDQQQYFYDKLTDFVNETIESIKSAPSSN